MFKKIEYVHVHANMCLECLWEHAQETGIALGGRIIKEGTRLTFHYNTLLFILDFLPGACIVYSKLTRLFRIIIIASAFPLES